MKKVVSKTWWIRMAALIVGILLLIPMICFPVMADDPGATEGESLAPIDPTTVKGIFFNSSNVMGRLGTTSVDLTAEVNYFRAIVTSTADPQIRVPVNANTSEYPYMVIRYRCNSPWDNWAYLADTTYNTGFSGTPGTYADPGFIADGEWHNSVFYFPEDFSLLSNTTLTWLRIPCGSEVGGYFDVAHVAFFKNEEDASRFEGYVSNNGCESVGHAWISATLTAPKTCAVCGATEGEPLSPIDPELVPGISFKNEPDNMNRLYGAGVEYIQEDGFLRGQTTADDAWVGIKNLVVNTSEYPYMAIRYRISGDYVSNWLYLTDDRVNPTFSATVGTWGAPKYLCDNEWHTVLYHFPTDFSAMSNVNLTSIRLPAAAAVGGYLDIEYIAFFNTEEDAARFEGYPERSECDKSGHTWILATCTTPKTCKICGEIEGDVKVHTWNEATCTAPKTCSVCGTTEGQVKGHTWTDATCAVPKTCNECHATEGDVGEHMWINATCTAPKTCSVCNITEGDILDHSWTHEGNEQICSTCGNKEVVTDVTDNEDSTNPENDTTIETANDHESQNTVDVRFILAVVGIVIVIAWIIVCVVFKFRENLSGIVFVVNIGISLVLLVVFVWIVVAMPAALMTNPDENNSFLETVISGTDAVTETEEVSDEEKNTDSYIIIPDSELLYSGPYSEKNGALAGIDNLSRVLPEEGEQKERTVGIFYFLGSEGNVNTEVGDVSKVLEKDPLAYESLDRWLAAGGKYNTSMYWGEPLFGYYSNEDDWVIHRHVQMFMDAGIDYIVFDTTNEYICAPNVKKVLQVLDFYYQQGLDVPQVAFYTHTSSGVIAMQIFDQIYQPNMERYAHLWFQWDGKPLIIADPNAAELTSEFKDFFHIKTPIWPNDKQYDRENAFPWMEFDRLYSRSAIYGKKDENGTFRKEVISVSVAQHCNTIMFSQTAFYGGNDHTRSWHDGANDPAPDAYLYGYNFAEQFEWAIEQDPETIFITGWNEWCAVCTYFRDDLGPIQMCDCVTANCSRDIEPMKGGYEDNYYMQMCAFIRQYKGCADRVDVGEDVTVDINGSFSQFQQATAIYTDPVGDTIERDHAGWGEYFSDASGRNDIAEIKILKDQTHYFVYIRTADHLTEPTADGWMTLLIDSGSEGGLGGAWDIAVNRTAPANGKTNVEKYENGVWTVIGTADIRYEGNQMMLSIERKRVDVSAQIGLCDIRFKVADNYTQDDVMSFYTTGDCAPYGRLSYIFSNKK